MTALEPTQTIVRLYLVEDPTVEAEVDEMWSFVQSKAQQRWLWWAINHETGEVLAYVLSIHEDDAFLQLKALLEPFGLSQVLHGWLGRIRKESTCCVTYCWKTQYPED